MTDRKRVLVVDDNAEFRQLYSLVLESERYEVTAHAEAEAGLREALSSPPDLIILDLMLGPADGREVYRALKADVRTSRIPIIVCTVHREQTISRKLDEKPALVLYKPFTPRELIAAVAEALS